MAEHHELVAEMTLLDKMTTQERLKLARKRRIQQLKKWNQKEKEYQSKESKSTKNNNTLTSSSIMPSKKATSSNQKGKTAAANNSKLKRPTKGSQGYKVHFVPSVMLLEAAARNDVEEVRRLLMLGVSPDSTNEDGLTALHQCCIDNSEEMMKLLIEFGADVNARDTESWTPLHAAATCGHLHLVRYLIDKGANLLAVNADGNMPYDICEDDTTLDYIEGEMAKRGITQEMIDETRAVTENMMLRDLKELAETGGDLEFRDLNSGATTLHVAAANGYLSVVEFLLEHHVSTDAVDNDLWQPLHAAACWGHPDILEALVQAGADLEAKTKNGETPLDICEDSELRERIIQLKSEMEEKEAMESTSGSHRLKRSHSSNTRSQSVRRTSIREKNQISRREAREEGSRLRASGGELATTTTVDESSRPSSQVNESKKVLNAQGDQVHQKNELGGSIKVGHVDHSNLKQEEEEELEQVILTLDSVSGGTVISRIPCHNQPSNHASRGGEVSSSWQLTNGHDDGSHTSFTTSSRQGGVEKSLSLFKPPPSNVVSSSIPSSISPSQSSPSPKATSKEAMSSLTDHSSSSYRQQQLPPH